MGSLQIQPPAQKPIPRIYLLLGALLFAAAVGVSTGGESPARLTVDGTAREVHSSATIADLAKAGFLKAESGKMVSVRGRVLARGSGVLARTWRNDKPVGEDAVVYDGDVIKSADGRNLVEPTVTERVPIAFPRRTVGSGPLTTLVSPGCPGVKELTTGAFSGEVVTSTVIVTAAPMVVKRYGANPHEKLVALTFDDGPWPGQTEQILHVLRQYHVRATFFMVGYLAKRQPALVRKVAAEGHLVGNHTMGHKVLTKLKPAVVDKQITQGQSTIQRLSGESSTWFRPPGGELSPAVWARIRRAHLKVALWNVDPQDWRRKPSKQIAHSVVTHVKPGSVVLMHDGGGDRSQTIKALPVIIRSLQSRGYRFVTLDEIPQL